MRNFLGFRTDRDFVDRAHRVLGHAVRAAQPQPRSPSSSSSELRADTEAAGLDPAQWIGGEFVFDWWPSDSLLTGHVERIDDIDE